MGNKKVSLFIRGVGGCLIAGLYWNDSVGIGISYLTCFSSFYPIHLSFLKAVRELMTERDKNIFILKLWDSTTILW